MPRYGGRDLQAINYGVAALIPYTEALRKSELSENTQIAPCYGHPSLSPA
jgi:hypothetical protein